MYLRAPFWVHYCLISLVMTTSSLSNCPLSYSHKYLKTTVSVLQSESMKLVTEFDNSRMEANPEKFQAIMLGLKGHENCLTLNVCGSKIKCEDTVKLLGVTFDYMLNFDNHISNICKKAARKINILMRFSKYLTLETRFLIYNFFFKIYL